MSLAAAVLLLAGEDPGGGFNPFEFATGATLWTWAAFLVALPLMWKFVYGPITKALEERDDKVERALKAADEAQRRADEQLRQGKAELDQARAEAKRMVEEAVDRAERQGREALAAARAEAERQTQKAREEIAAEKRKALVELRTEAVDLAIRAAGHLMQSKVDDDAQRRLVQQFLSDPAVSGPASRN
jgi:F-type H+-transporting ATPase subunit b